MFQIGFQINTALKLGLLLYIQEVSTQQTQNSTQQTQNICITFVQCMTNVEEACFVFSG